jgi:hypothetical protein
MTYTEVNKGKGTWNEKCKQIYTNRHSICLTAFNIQNVLQNICNRIYRPIRRTSLRLINRLRLLQEQNLYKLPLVQNFGIKTLLAEKNGSDAKLNTVACDFILWDSEDFSGSSSEESASESEQMNDDCELLADFF